MKELSIEEKAKACDSNYKVYTELINRLEDVKEAIKKQNYGIAMDVLCKSYPEFQVTTHSELKESEDERIRKALMQNLKERFGTKGNMGEGLDMPDVLAWIEKQGKNNMGISEATKQELEDNLNKALEKETPESWNKFLDEQGEQKSMKTCAEYYNQDNKLKMPELSEFQNKLADILMYREYDGPDETEEDIAKGRLEYELAAIRLSEELLPLAQKEQKPADKAEQKFEIGDWIVQNGYGIFKVVEVKDTVYTVSDYDENLYYVPFYEENNCKLWTIQDAKDGDVLVDGNLPFLFKKIDVNKHSYAHCGISVYNDFKVKSDGEYGEWTWMQNIKPATKEQRDLLFQKMHEAGYEWDAEKKELKKIEQNPAWSEEDDIRLNATVSFLERYKGIDYENTGVCISWLKSLKDRYTWKPSDEQINNK